LRQYLHAQMADGRHIHRIILYHINSMEHIYAQKVSVVQSIGTYFKSNEGFSRDKQLEFSKEITKLL